MTVLRCASIIVLVAFASLEAVYACSEDYSPCSCDNSTGLNDITCVGIRVQDIKTVFSRTQQQILGSLSVTFSNSDSSVPVPADVVAGKTFIGRMSLACTNYNHVLRINPDAFGPSNNFTAAIFYGCNINQQPDFSFFTNFTELKELSMERMSNFNNFSGLPPSLIHIEIINNRGFDSVYSSQVRLPNLKHLLLNTNGLTDTTVRNALDALTSFSADPLEVLELHDNLLQEIPASVNQFTKLASLTLQNNGIFSVSNGALTFPATSNAANINLDNNVIQFISNGAFQDGINVLSLKTNKLTKFADTIYLPLLESFDRKGSGSVQIAGNRFMCDCDLNWLIRDYRHLLQYVQGGSCSNSTSFEDLSPDGFGGCPTDEFKCPSADGNYSAGPCSGYYYACVSSLAYVIYCPEGLVYDDWLDKCVNPVGCP